MLEWRPLFRFGDTKMRIEDADDAALLQALLSLRSDIIGPLQPRQAPAMLRHYLRQVEDVGELQGVLIETLGRLRSMQRKS
jgi:hypothetical protein